MFNLHWNSANCQMPLPSQQEPTTSSSTNLFTSCRRTLTRWTVDVRLSYTSPQSYSRVIESHWIMPLYHQDAELLSPSRHFLILSQRRSLFTRARFIEYSGPQAPKIRPSLPRNCMPSRKSLIRPGVPKVTTGCNQSDIRVGHDTSLRVKEPA